MSVNELRSHFKGFLRNICESDCEVGVQYSASKPLLIIQTTLAPSNLSHIGLSHYKNTNKNINRKFSHAEKNLTFKNDSEDKHDGEHAENVLHESSFFFLFFFTSLVLILSRLTVQCKPDNHLRCSEKLSSSSV